MREIISMKPEYLQSSLELVEQVFTDHESAEEGRTVRSLVEEIRRKENYLPELELLMLEDGAPIGYVMLSRFHIEGRYQDRLLILTPAAVRTDRQRQHISRDLIERAFDLARGMGYTAVLVEGNPANYRSRGFRTSANYGVVAAPSVHLPHPDCLMLAELVPGGLEGIHGEVEYSMYETLS
ncbi:MAG: N-acetyltransferase [Clostridiales bacterium]|nr:N-acetyltransferase [Clostridiales bacterium]